MEKKFKESKFSLFFKKNIYLILMVVCLIAIIGMIAYTFTKQQNSASDPVGNLGVQDTNKPSEDIKNPNDDSSNSTDNNGDNNGNQNQVVQTLREIGMPIDGAEVLKVYTDTELVFNATMKHWSTHQAIDYKAEVGSKVVAVFDGVVTNISTTTLKGTTVTIKHSDGFESIYSLLGSDVKVKVGDKVKKGDMLGTVQESGVFESADPSHLHFEFKKDGQLIDPSYYFGDQNK